VLATIKTMHDPFVVTLEHSKTRRRASHTCLAPYIVAPSSARGQSKAALPIVIRFGRGDCGHRQELSTRYHDTSTGRSRTYIYDCGYYVSSSTERSISNRRRLGLQFTQKPYTSTTLHPSIAPFSFQVG